MKLLVSTTGRQLDSAIDPRFGRALLFAIFDTDTGSLEVIDNRSGRDAAQGAGIQAAEVAARMGAQVVITGHCGPKAFEALTAAGIAVVAGASGSVADAIAAYRAGTLQATAAPDVRGHW
jgi:predicted Fe-Mo cluster-binding NifX family protein